MDFAKQAKTNYDRAKTRLGLKGETKPGDLLTASYLKAEAKEKSHAKQSAKGKAHEAKESKAHEKKEHKPLTTKSRLVKGAL
jgi:hypothetical protein